MECDTDTGVCVCWMKMNVKLGGGEVGSRLNYTTFYKKLIKIGIESTIFQRW